MEKINIEIVILVFGMVILIIGLFGRLETKWFKVGSDSTWIRTLAFFIGVLLVILSIIPNIHIKNDDDENAQVSAANTNADGLQQKLDSQSEDDAKCRNELNELKSQFIELQNKYDNEQQKRSIAFSEVDQLQQKLDSESDKGAKCSNELNKKEASLRKAQKEIERQKKSYPRIRDIKGKWEMKANKTDMTLKIIDQDRHLFEGETVELDGKFSYVWGSFKNEKIEFKRVQKPEGFVQEYRGELRDHGYMSGKYCYKGKCTYPWKAKR